MEIRINDKNEIIEYASLGGLSDSTEIDDSLKPVDFDQLFKPRIYLYQDNEIIINPNYEKPTVDIPETPEPSEPSKEWQAINMLALQIAQLKAEKGGA